mmetsp:Transcript_10230/g.62435  ORF Transcript_10230/g.62435 Transcript_10230/m.62435 type:complete len:654 (+) Transcript_10230:462-2423(+)
MAEADDVGMVTRSKRRGKRSEESVAMGVINVQPTDECREESTGERRKRKSPKKKATSNTKHEGEDSKDQADIRDKVVEALEAGLEKARIENPGLVKMKPAAVGREIEQALFLKYGGLSREYKAKYRSLAFNLKSDGNPELRRRVLAKDISASELCSYGPQEMVSHEEREKRKAMAAEKDKLIVIEQDADAPRIRKTHKGEEAVGPSNDEVVLVDVSVAPHEKSASRAESDKVCKASQESEDQVEMNQEEQMDIAEPKEEAESGMGTEPSKKFVTLDELETQLVPNPPSGEEPTTSERYVTEYYPDEEKSHLLQENPVSPENEARLGAVNFDRTRLGNVLWQGMISYEGCPTCEGEAYLRGKEEIVEELRDFLKVPDALLIKREVRIREMDKYFRDLSKSRSRTIFYALLFPVDCNSIDSSTLPLAQKVRQLNFMKLSDALARKGLVGFAAGVDRVELYFLPPSTLSNKILHSRGGGDLLPGSMLLAVVHPKFASKVPSGSVQHTEQSDGVPDEQQKISQDLLALAGPLGAKALEELLKQSSEKVTHMASNVQNDYSQMHDSQYPNTSTYADTQGYGMPASYGELQMQGMSYTASGENPYGNWHYDQAGQIQGTHGYDWGSAPHSGLPPPPPLPYPPPPPGPPGGSGLGRYYQP